MSFLQSASNQMGRDLGRAISKSVNKSSQPSKQLTKSYKPVQTDFGKSINFALSTEPVSLLNKLTNAYIVMKKEMSIFLLDGYLDNLERDKLFTMLLQFNTKCEDIDDLLSLDEEKNKVSIDRLLKIQSALKLDFLNLLEKSIKGCEKQGVYLEGSKVSFWKYVGFHIILMSKYINGASKDLTETILGNLLSLLVFPFVQIFMGFKGVFTFKRYIKKIDSKINSENTSISIYTKLITSNS